MQHESETKYQSPLRKPNYNSRNQVANISTFRDFVKYGNPRPIFNKSEFRAHKIPRKLICLKDLVSSSKPSISYTQIIMEAIVSYNNNAMLNEIYKYIEKKYPYYRNLSKENWKGSIRHNLSLCKMFKRIPKEGKKGKGGYWCFNEDYIRDSNSNNEFTAFLKKTENLL